MDAVEARPRSAGLVQVDAVLPRTAAVGCRRRVVRGRHVCRQVVGNRREHARCLRQDAEPVTDRRGCSVETALRVCDDLVAVAVAQVGVVEQLGEDLAHVGRAERLGADVGELRGKPGGRLLEADLVQLGGRQREAPYGARQAPHRAARRRPGSTGRGGRAAPRVRARRRTRRDSGRRPVAGCRAPRRTSPRARRRRRPRCPDRRAGRTGRHRGDCSSIRRPGASIG